MFVDGGCDNYRKKEVMILVKAVVMVLTVGITVAALLTISSDALLGGYSLFPAIDAYASSGTLTTDSMTGLMYVQNTNSNSISVIDLATNTFLRNITIDGTTQNIKLSEDQQILYIVTTTRDAGTIYMLNTTGNEIMNERISTQIPAQDVAFFNDTLYLSDAVGGKVLVMNSNGSLLHEINVGARPQFIEVRPDGQVLYVARSGGPISVVDLKQNIVIKEIDSGTPHHLSFDNNGARLFVVNSENDTLSVIDSQKHEIIKTTPVGDNPRHVVLEPEETLAYVANMDSDTISMVDNQLVEVVNEIPIGDGPYGIALSADGGDLLYVSNTRGNDISVIDTKSNTITATIAAGGAGPNQMVVRNPFIDIVRPENANNNGNNNSSFISRVFVEVPDDEEEHMRGLMFRQHLPSNAGMLFAFSSEEPRAFWMKNTLVPLDMIFVNDNSEIVDIIENVPPCEQDPCPSYPSEEPAQYVLEVNAGFVQQTGVHVGDRLISDIQ
jgi:YVTN family beta-propeller protein